MVLRPKFLLVSLIVITGIRCDALSLPTVTLKIALDASGGVVDLSEEGTVERFTCPESLDMVHRLRALSDAVLVGRNTVVMDNPSLLVRRGVSLQGGKQPLRVVLDSNLQLDYEKYQLFNDGHPTIVYHANDLKLSQSTDGNAVSFVGVCQDVDNRLSVKDLCEDLYSNRKVHHLMVEGGPSTARAFLRDGLVDQCIVVRATTVKFLRPMPSGISRDVLCRSGLLHLGNYVSGGVDEVECWSKTGSWPTGSSLPGWP